MAIKNALREREVLTVNAGAVRRLKLPYVDPQRIRCYQRISWEISLATAGGNTRCRLVIEKPAYDIPIAEQQVPVATVLYWWPYPVWLHDGERLALLIDQPQNGTVAQLHGVGYWVDEKEGVI